MLFPEGPSGVLGVTPKTSDVAMGQNPLLPVNIPIPTID